MDKLGEFSTQTERFLRSLAIDLGLPARKGEWLASKFTNESVAFDGEYPDAVPDAVVARGVEGLSLITGEEPLAAVNRGVFSYGTAAEFSRIGKIMDPDEVFYIGLYRDGDDEPDEWREVTYRRAAEMRSLLDAPIPSYGSVQGTPHAWHPGSEPPFFQVRELSGSTLVRCTYGASLYARVHAAFQKPKTVVHVYGDIEWDRATNLIVEMRATDIEVAETLSDFEFQRLIGIAPNFTGSLSTEDYIEWIRGDGD
jgi:hypothetical protein